MSALASDSVPARAAAFLDRDGTIVEDRHYLADAAELRLLPDAAVAIRTLNDAGVPVVIVTNQSAIARGLLSEAGYADIARTLHEMLAAEGARVTATYHCPHHPDFTGRCDCRKPGTALYRRAAAEHGLDLARSLYAGDRWRDVAPTLQLGGVGLLVPSANTPPDELARAERERRVTHDLADAVARFLAGVNR